MSVAAAAVALVTAVSAVATPAAAPSPVGRVLFHLVDPRITESSGIAVATREPGVWFTHNDSGDSARFFALGPTGRTLATYDVDGVKAVDWEDMAAAPLRGVPTLWFADIGDNDASRQDVSVYAVREPAVFPGTSGITVHVKAVRYRFRYPDGPRDAESLLVDPRTSRIYLASKALDGDTRVYAAPAQPSTSTVNDLSELADVQWVPQPRGSLVNLALQVMTTGGAFSPDGRSFVLRTYTDAYVFPLQGAGPLAVARALVSPPVHVALPEQMQGEGVAFRRDGRALVISSEHVGTAVDEVLLPQATPATPHATSPTPAPESSVAPAASGVPASSGAPAAQQSRSAGAPPSSAHSAGGHSRSSPPVVAGALALGVLAAGALVARRRRAGPARSRR